jgi:predicted GIY-YIG superfamily endonuclease
MGNLLLRLRSAFEDRPSILVWLNAEFANPTANHNQGLVPSTKKRAPFQLVYWEGCLNESDPAQCEKYLKTAWGKRYIKTRLRRYLTG